jgi:hypothetical protein
MEMAATTEMPVWMPQQSSEYIQRLEAKKAQEKIKSSFRDRFSSIIYAGMIKKIWQMMPFFLLHMLTSSYSEISSVELVRNASESNFGPITNHMKKINALCNSDLVEEKQQSLAIGKKGQNVRLASRLIGWQIDVKSEEQKKQEVLSVMESLTSSSTSLTELEGVSERLVKARACLTYQSVVLTLVILEGRDTSAIERVTRERGALHSEVLVPNRARILVAARTDSLSCVTEADVRVFAWGAADGATPAKRVNVRLSGDSVRVEASARGVSQSAARPFPGCGGIAGFAGLHQFVILYAPAVGGHVRSLRGAA